MSRLTRVRAGQVALNAATATLVVAANIERTSVHIKNPDAAIVIYIGEADVTALNGYPLAAGAAVFIENNSGPIFAIAASATPNAAFLEY